MSKDCIFCKIVKKELPKEFILETDQVMVFPDIAPVAPVHLLVVPKNHIREFGALGELGDEDWQIWQEMVKILIELIRKYELINKGYRIITNGGGAQLIDHFHIHLMGGIAKERKL